MVFDSNLSPAQVQVDTLIRNIRQLVTVSCQAIVGAEGPLQVLEQAALAVFQGNIVWLGSDEDAERLLQTNIFVSPAGMVTIIDMHGLVVTPGFVDAHTHLIFAGNRAAEFHLRHAGVSYAELLAQGRGILTTVQATREASDELLIALAEERLESVQSYGTTTVEVKTGYGLDRATEERCLRIVHTLQEKNEHRVRIVPTFLGAHTVPVEYQAKRKEYINLIVEQMLPAFQGLARFCDVFCEREAFSVQESRRILTRAKELGYLLKIHTGQLNASGGARLAAELGATSADHLDHASDADLDALREAGVVATLLPGCSYTLRSPYPSARRLLERGLTVALATDFNPGTSYCENMQMMMGLGMSAMGMTLEEALRAVTIHGAKALALEEQIGSIEVGKRCELALWDIGDYREIGYHFGVNLVQSTMIL